ncbi:MAG: ACP phosphodiesterase, partial [Oscillospiraceae bacterium]|nr:ACP phosphodiesterase [Oscillospiraceae bacterium]
MTLFINACVRRESRTERLAERLLSKLKGPIVELRLEDISSPPVDEAYLMRRDGFIEKGDCSDPMFDMARQFAGADTIVVAAPYWDLSFP